MRSSRLVIALILVSGVALAQEFRASVQGTITDQTGAVIPGMELVLTNVDTGVERSATTNNNGLYIFQFLSPGRYRLTASGEGFKTQVREGIDLSIGQSQRVDLEMELGAVTETVEVVGEIALVDTDTSSIGATVRSEIKDNLPLKGHSSLYMFTLAPGVVNNRYGEDTRSNDTISNVSFSANGSPWVSGDVSVDGAINTVNVNREVNISQWVPSVDAIAEFKLESGTMSAEHGRTGGSMINIVIKSGTNDFHGSIFEFFQNSKLNANQFFQRGLDQPLPGFGANTYGATVGGPIKRNQSFFFFSYEGSREGNNRSFTNTVPTAAMRRGDFSEITAPLYDPYSVANVDGVPTRELFPNNIIPQSRMDVVGRNAMDFFPEPNATGSRNFSFSSKWPRNYDVVVTKFDHQIKDNWTFFARMNRGVGELIFPHQFEGIATPGRNRVNRPHFGVTIGNTISLGPRDTFDIRLGYAWGQEKRRPWSEGFDLGTLGFDPSFVNIVQSTNFPRMNFSGFQGFANSDFRTQPGYTWTLQPSISMMRGKHLIKAGFAGRLVYGNFFANPAPSGNFSFNQNWTNGPRADRPSSGTGHTIASALLGLGSGSITFNSGLSILNKYYAGYVQDDWKVSDRLTLNLGLRYSFETGRTERFDRASRGFCFTCTNPVDSQVPGLDLLGGLTFVGVDGQPREIYDNDTNNFAPRIGISYRLNEQTVIRSGYGLYYIPVVSTVESPGFDSQTTWVTSEDGITSLNPLSSPFPTGHAAITGSSLGLLTRVGQSIRFVEPTDRTPMFHTWNFGVQRALPGQSVIELSYVGSRGVALAASQNEGGFSENINQLHPQFLAMGDALLDRIDNPFFGAISEGALSGPVIQRQQLLRIYPQFLNIARQKPAFGNSVYHSFQARFQKRMANGLASLISYTASKLIDDLSPAQNHFNRQAERAVSEHDVPQRLTVTLAYELPFGQGRKWGQNMRGATNAIAGGWTVSTFSTFQSGFPLTFRNSRSTIFATGAGAQRPDVVGDPAQGASGSHVERLDGFFNTAAFAQPDDFTFGNLAARLHSVRRPGMNNINLSLTKTFHITERLNIQFRASSYNFMNHPVFSVPNTTFGTGQFGRIFGQANISRQTEFMLRIRF